MRANREDLRWPRLSPRPLVHVRRSVLRGVSVGEHHRYGLNVYRPADRRMRTLWNRYPSGIIGAGVVVFGWAWGIRWGRPDVNKGDWS